MIRRQEIEAIVNAIIDERLEALASAFDEQGHYDLAQALRRNIQDDFNLAARSERVAFLGEKS